MRLLHTKTFQLHEFLDNDPRELRYAILSHTWETEEVTFTDIQDLTKARAKNGFAKIEGACKLASSKGYEFIWIDTCCIDKSSSAELSEAINSMYRWYSISCVCYAFLSDVEGLEELEHSRWFTRGWTLQELIAPLRVEFYTKNWTFIGLKGDPDLISVVSRASLVDQFILSGKESPGSVCVARRMYWASRRQTR